MTPKPTAFATPAAFRHWLSRHHASASELLVRCYKSHAAGQGMTYTEALDEALCFGWIDGVRRRVDDSSFSVRFSPRKPKSFWSAVNTRRARVLVAAGRMQAAGKAAFTARDAKAKARYSFESKPLALAPTYLAKLRAAPGALAFFRSQAPWYRRTSAFWVMSAKREETREKRLAVLVACSARKERIPLLRKEPARAR